MLSKILNPFAIIGSLLTIWFGSMITLMVVFDISKNALIIGDPAPILARLEDDARIIRVNKNSMILNSAKPGFTKNLYEAGAWIVLPALNSGCLVLNKS